MKRVAFMTSGGFIIDKRGRQRRQERRRGQQQVEVFGLQVIDLRLIKIKLNNPNPYPLNPI